MFVYLWLKQLKFKTMKKTNNNWIIVVLIAIQTLLMAYVHNFTDIRIF